MREARRHNAYAGIAQRLYRMLRRLRRGEVDVSDGTVQQRVAHGTADDASLRQGVPDAQKRCIPGKRRRIET